MAEAAADTGPDRDALAAQIAKADLAIDRLLNLLEQAEDSASLLARLKDREADRSRLQQALDATHQDTPARALPTASELIAGYADQVARLESLLTGAGAVIEANAVLQAMLGTVALAPDPDAPDGLRMEIRSSAARCFLNEGLRSNAKGLPREATLICSKISVVAGARIGLCRKRRCSSRWRAEPPLRSGRHRAPPAPWALITTPENHPKLQLAA
ncbi:MAG: hypothetical protein WA957_12870 [Alteraurantiacibacter sp.]